MEEKFMIRAIELAKNVLPYDEVPIGAVIVYNGEIIAESANSKERDNSALSHAEINAIKAATKKMGWMLCDCDIYVTLEPCAMCAGAIINSRIKNLYFGAYDKKAGCCGSLYNLPEDNRFNHRVHVEGGIFEQECSKLLTDFFKAKRK